MWQGFAYGAALHYRELLPQILCCLWCCSGMYTHGSKAMHRGAWCVCCYAAELIEHNVKQESFKPAVHFTSRLICGSSVNIVCHGVSDSQEQERSSLSFHTKNAQSLQTIQRPEKPNHCVTIWLYNVIQYVTSDMCKYMYSLFLGL